MELILAVLLLVLVVVFVIGVRAKDLPEPELQNPARHIEERRARVYEGLRDLQFEYRLGKLSDDDYQRTKLGLQSELAAVLAELEQFKPAQTPPPKPDPLVCPHCKARMPKPMKFCGECGKPMKEGGA